jgi:Sulfotransferase family
MIEEPFKAIASDLDPLVISAPTIRCGTTLLQRLLCSSSRALIYGELCAQDLEFLLNLYVFKSQQYQTRKREVAAALDSVLTRNVDNWIPTLMPDVDEYLKALGRGAFSGIEYCREYARSAGRPVWGFKYPGWNPAMLQLVRALMPRARFVFIHRELKDCLGSAKTHSLSYGTAYSKDDIREFCRAWAENENYMLSLCGEAEVLSLQYQDLVSEPQATLAKLAEFTGVEDMDPKVLDRKINAWVGSESVNQSKDGYFPPAGLDDFDWQMINATAPAVMGQASAR